MSDRPVAKWKWSPFLFGRNGSSVVRQPPSNHRYWRRELAELRSIVGKDIDAMTDAERSFHFDRVRRFNQRQSVSPFDGDLARKAREVLDGGAADN